MEWERRGREGREERRRGPERKHVHYSIVTSVLVFLGSCSCPLTLAAAVAHCVGAPGTLVEYSCQSLYARKEGNTA